VRSFGGTLLLIKSFCCAVLINSSIRLGYECDKETRSNDIAVNDSRLDTPIMFDPGFNTNGLAPVLLCCQSKTSYVKEH